MNNWFEDSPTRAIIVHTILVASATWLVSTYILDENKINFYRAESVSYKAKVEVLESEIERLRNENERYLNWLQESPSTLPYLTSRIDSLTSQNTRLLSARRPSPVDPEVSPGPAQYHIWRLLYEPEAFVDRTTNVALGISQIYYDKTADVTLSLPGKQSESFRDVKLGTSWDFEHQGSKYTITLRNEQKITYKAFG